MLKRKVGLFFLLLLAFALAIFLIQGLFFKGITGNVIQEDEYKYNSEYEIFISDYKVLDGKLYVYYKIINLIGQEQDIKLEYLFSGNENLQGTKELVLSGESGNYILDVNLPKEKGVYNLIMNFDNGNSVKENMVEGLVVSSNKLNGLVVMEQIVPRLSLLTVVAGLIFLFLILSAKFYRKKNSVNELKKNVGNRYIKLNMN